MTTLSARFGFVECADLISEQKYGASLKMFHQAVSSFQESKSNPRRSEIARHLRQIGTALEETLKKAFGDQWDIHIPRFADENKPLNCSFCGKSQNEVRKLIAGHSVHICNECVGVCDEILTKENIDRSEAAEKPAADADAERLCGICMEPRETDELVFLPHAAYMCAGCLEEIQIVRDKRGE